MATSVSARLARARKTEPKSAIPTEDKEIYETEDVEDDLPATLEEERQSIGGAKQKEGVDTSPNDPLVSFEKFSNMMYYAPKGRDLSDAVNPRPIASQTSFGIDTGSRRLETPLEAYDRLKVEVTQLLKDFDLISKEFGATKNFDSILSPELVSGLKSLQDELTSIATDPRFGFVVAHSSGGSGHQRGEEVVAALSHMTNTTPSLPPITPQGGGQMVYELYVDPAAPARAEASSEVLQLSQLNQRIANLENVVGVNTGPPTKDLKSTVEELTRWSKLLDQGYLEVVNLRIETLSKTLTDGSLVARQKQTQTKKIETLFDLVTKVDGVLTEIPTLIARLQSLQRVHEMGAAFVSNVERLQTQQAAITQTLTAQGVAVKEVEESMVSNMQVLLDNFKSIQSRMSALEAKLG